MPAGRPPLWIGLFALVLAGGASLAAETPPPRLHGTFIQLSQAHGAWAEGSWRRLFGYLAQLRALEIVVQWTVYDDMAFYPSARHTPVAQPPLETILTLADELGMTVRVGLAHDSAFWSRINRDPATVAVYLRDLQARSESVARELVPLIRRHRSFRGWYITEEIEDATWKDERARAALFDYLRRLTLSVRALAPGASVAVSGFSNAETAPATFGAFWTSLLRAASIDVFMFQDGVGAGKQRLSFLPLYLAAAHEAAQTAGHASQRSRTDESPAGGLQSLHRLPQVSDVEEWVEVEARKPIAHDPDALSVAQDVFREALRELEEDLRLDGAEVLRQDLAPV